MQKSPESNSPCLKRRSRVDANGRAYAGSQRQIQTYVNDFPDVLNHAVAHAVGNCFPQRAAIHWVSPLAPERYTEYRDDDFLRVLGLSEYSRELAQFWPRGGPCWDALGRFESGQNRGCILVEAKSHIAECYGGDTRAAGHSVALIRNSLNKAKSWFGVPDSAIWTGFENQTQCLYQYANRLAHLFFLRAVVNVPAYLVNIYFTDDPYRRTSEHEWRKAVSAMHGELKLPVQFQFVADVFLPAKP